MSEKLKKNRNSLLINSALFGKLKKEKNILNSYFIRLSNSF